MKTITIPLELAERLVDYLEQDEPFEQEFYHAFKDIIKAEPKRILIETSTTPAEAYRDGGQVNFIMPSPWVDLEVSIRKVKRLGLLNALEDSKAGNGQAYHYLERVNSYNHLLSVLTLEDEVHIMDLIEAHADD